MFPSALRRNRSHRAFYDFKQGLLYAFTAYIPCNRGVLAFSSDFVDFVDEDYAPFSCLNVSVCRIDELEEDIFNVFAYLAGFRKGSGICNGKGNVQLLGKGFCKKCLTASCRSYEKNV